jgi:hypothetical protein
VTGHFFLSRASQMSDEWCLVEPDAPVEPVDTNGLGGCRPGDHVSAPRAYGLYRHHGVLLDGGRVLHLNGGLYSAWDVCLGLRPAMVRIDPVARFLKTVPKLRLEHAGDATRLLPEGADGVPMPYHLLWGNCEQFARAAVGRSRRSLQVERVLIGAGWLVVAAAAPTLAVTAAVGSLAAHAAFSS